MKIGIFGTGNLASGLGRGWARAGHYVFFGSRTPPRGMALAQAVGAEARGGGIAEAARFGEAALLATPWAGAREALLAAGPLDDKLLIDGTNPFSPDSRALVLGRDDSGGEQVARWAPGARVVKAFNYVYAQVIHTGPRFPAGNATVFYCGDDGAAKAVVAVLIAELGFEPVDAGPLTSARTLEPLALLAVTLAYDMGMGTNRAFKLIHR